MAKKEIDELLGVCEGLRTDGSVGSWQHMVKRDSEDTLEMIEGIEDDSSRNKIVATLLLALNKAKLDAAMVVVNEEKANDICPGCRCWTVEGVTDGCDHPDGCGAL